MPREKRDVERALLKKGFFERPGDHMRLVYIRLSGATTELKTMTSRSPKVRTLDDGLLSLMARQLTLSRSELERFLDCSMSREEYEALMVSRGVLPPA